MIKMKKTYSPIRFYLANIILFVVILLVLMVLLSAVIFRVEKVEVKGNRIYSDSVVEELILDDKYKKNGLYDVVKNIIKPKRNIPFINKVNVSFAGRNTIRIKVDEKKIDGYLIENEKYVYFDDDAIVQEISDQLIDQAIRTDGLEAKDSKVGKEINAASGRARAVSVIYKNIKSRDIPVSKVTFDESDGTISLKSSKITVMLGTKSNLEEKMRRLSYILPKLKNRKGTLHLEDFSDENTDIVFDKNN